MATTIVDRLYGDFNAVVDCLGEAEISLRSTAQDNFRKALLLAAASYFEKRVKEQIVDLVAQFTGNFELVTEFVRNKAMERQYHTYFGWTGRNANSFYGLFGEGFKKYMTDIVQANDEYKASVVAFLELGNERNRLVHMDFGEIPRGKTAEEIYGLYKTATTFVESLSGHFATYVKANQSESSDDKSA